MVKTIKIQHKEIFPNGEWRKIAHEKDHCEELDDEIYYYMDNDFDMWSLKEGDTIMLDEEFRVLEVE